MDGVHTVLQNLQLLVFLSAALAAFRMWWLHRGRPAALLAATFGTLGLTLLVSRSLPAGPDGAFIGLLRDLVLIGLVAFPWLLALFAWSFEPRFPPWLRYAGGAIAGLAVWTLIMPPLPTAGEPSSTQQSAFVAVFVGVWAALGIAAAARLWRAGGSQPLVRARMRLMATGALVLTLAILLAGFTLGDDSPFLPLFTNGLAIVSALLFLAGFAPPRPLRMWWRRRAASQWQDMQLRLIAAATPREAAVAVIPMVADMVGGGAAIVARDGELLAHAGLGDDEADQIAGQIRADRAPSAGDEHVPVDNCFLVVRPTPYSPLFGQDEREMVTSFALQLQLAFERATLYEENERRRRELQRSHHDLQALMVGLAHDLRSPSVAINGYSSLLLSADTDAERRELVEGITTSSAYLHQLVDSLIELSRVGATQTEVQPVDLQATVATVAERLAVIHPGVRVVAESLPTVSANPVAIQQVLENLLSNAAKHGGRDDLTVTITSHAGLAGVTIDVRDDGQGIHPDDRDAIFTPFRRGRGAAAGGSGVGLGLVRRILESHGGSIALIDHDQGAHFRIQLPG